MLALPLYITLTPGPGYLSASISFLNQFIDSEKVRLPRVLVFLGVVSTLLYILLELWTANDVKKIAEDVMLWSFFISIWWYRRQFTGDWIFRLMLIALLLPVLLYGVDLIFDPEAAEKYRTFDDLVALFLFLPIAWWLGGKRALIYSAAFLGFLGLILGVLSDPDLARSITRLIGAKRVDFGMHNAQHSGLLFSLCILFSVCHFRLWRKGAFRYSPLIIVIPALVLGIVGLVGSQTRAMFLGFMVCALVALLRFIWSIRQSREKTFNVKNSFLPVFAIVVIFSLGTYSVLDRVKPALDIMPQVLKGDLDSIPYTPAGIRLHSWAESIDWIIQKPLIGWGRGARSDVMGLAKQHPKRIRKYGHLHNSYLELVLGFGLVGLLFVGAFWWLLLNRIRSEGDDDSKRFVLYGSIFFLVVNLFESYLFYWSGIYFFAVLMGLGYSSSQSQILKNSLLGDGNNA